MKYLTCALILIALFAPESAAAWTPSDYRELITRMENAYSAVQDYQTNLVITGFGKDSAFQKTQRLLYTFKKPDKVRLDFESPHRGMVIIYPDKQGKVLIRPNRWIPFLTFHLDPGNAMLELSPGQQIDRTDLGVLIRNISHSLTDMLLGDLAVKTAGKHIVISMLSDNPFSNGIPTRYVFFIDNRLWLPVAVKESSAQGVLQRKVLYENLRLNVGVADDFFELD